MMLELREFSSSLLVTSPGERWRGFSVWEARGLRGCGVKRKKGWRGRCEGEAVWYLSGGSAIVSEEMEW